MKKRIMLLGSILMVAASSLDAAVFYNPGNFALDRSPAAFHGQITLRPAGQIADALLADGQGFPILDIRRPVNVKSADVAGIFRLPPAFDMSRPVAPVPEPMHYTLMGLGLVGLYLARRDRLSAK